MRCWMVDVTQAAIGPAEGGVGRVCDEGVKGGGGGW